MNHNYVRKCEEYLQNIPSQKMPPRVQRRDTTPGRRGMSPAATAATTTIGGRNLSSRKSFQQQPMPGVREKQPINNPGAGGVDVATSLARGKKFPNPGQQEKQQGSKFSRPCCRQQQQQNRVVGGSNAPEGRNGPGGTSASAHGSGKTSDNVNQLDNMKLVEVQPDGDYGGRAAVAGLGPRSDVGDGIQLQQQNVKSGTESWDGILTASSLSQIKSKNASDHISSPIIPPGPTSTPVAVSSSPSSSSLSTRPTSSIVAVAPQPRRPSATTLIPPTSSPRVPMCKSSELETGINLFRFDPLRTLQFLTLELKSKLKALGGGSSSTGSDHKQLYKISKELLLAVRILTESRDVQKSTEKCCKHCEQQIFEPTLNKPATSITTDPAILECETCSKLQNELIQQSERHSHDTEQLKEEINYLKARLLTQLDTKESKASTEQPAQPQPPTPAPAMVTTDQQQLLQQQRRLEGEIKRLQTMISDKQTLEDGLIADLNRKLQEATSRCRRLEQARNEAEKRLLYATLENERLNFLLSTQASTMTNLQSDFNVIENLAHQQIDLLVDRSQSPPNGTRTSATRPGSNNKASNPIITIIDNHHRNYRHSSGGNPPSSTSSSSSEDCSSSSNSNQQPFSSHHHRRRRRDWQQQSPNADITIATTSSIQEKPDAYGLAAAEEKLRKQKRHYGFKNIAEKESDDDGNDANDLKPSTTKALQGGSDQGSDTETAAFRHHQQDDDHEMNVHCKAVASGSHNAGKTGTYFQSPAMMLQSSSAGSLSSVASKRFGPARRTILIDSDCELSLPEQKRPIDDDNHGNGEGNQTYAVTDPRAKKRFPLADGPTEDGDDDDDPIGSSKTNNDCASRRRPPWQETDIAAARGRPSLTGKGKKDNDGEDEDEDDAVVEKYPRDYGDKFERRESCLLQSEKELCQNRPIIGQIRQGSSNDVVGAGNRSKKDAKVSEGRKTISAANEPASARTTEEFSIDFDDITLPSSPAPFRGGCLSSIAGDLASDDD